MTTPSSLGEMTTHNPVFIFSSSWRSGSTLVQRYVTASGEVLVWGETGGALNALAQALQGWEKIGADPAIRFDHTLGGGGEAAYHTLLFTPKTEHAGMWIANLTPPYTEIQSQLCAWMDQVYGARARALGYSRYGIKETRCDIATAKRLSLMFPDARFVFLVRNPMDVMTSIKRRNLIGRPASLATLRYYAQHWLTRSRQFRQANFGFAVRYEDFVNDASVRARLLDHLGIAHAPPDDFVASSRVDWQTRDERKLTVFERVMLHYWLGDEMRAWEY